MLTDKANRALAGVSKAASKKEVKVKHLFRIMTRCDDLWLMAYAKIQSNKGALTKGVDGSTIDGMSKERINGLMQKVLDGSYQPKPVKRVYIPKSNGKKRPLGVPTADDKLVQEVVRYLLELVYEPNFSDDSHGFRPRRSCHTALGKMQRCWKSVKWFVDTDISGYFDNINHKKLIEILEKKIDDKKFILLIRKFLRAGYLEDWKFNKTYSGTPQGGICSPILANIYLHELDQFIERKQQEYTKGESRQWHDKYRKLTKRIGNRRVRLRDLKKNASGGPKIFKLETELAWLLEQREGLPSLDPNDPNFRRLYYTRYADDFILGVVGPKHEAVKLQEEIKEFLNKELDLKVSSEKSGIHHGQKGTNYLGYHLMISANNERRRKQMIGMNKDGNKVFATCRSLQGQLHLKLPKERARQFLTQKGYVKKGKPSHVSPRISSSDYEIVSLYNAELRGFVNYYALAPKRDMYFVQSMAHRSLFKTLASKHKKSACRIRNSMKFNDEHILWHTRNGKRKGLRVFKVKHRFEPSLNSRVDNVPNSAPFMSSTELLNRLNANECEYCRKKDGPFEVHHIRKMKDIENRKEKSSFDLVMIGRQRKTMVLCRDCHKELHKGKLPGWKKDAFNKMESAVL